MLVSFFASGSKKKYNKKKEKKRRKEKKKKFHSLSSTNYFLGNNNIVVLKIKLWECVWDNSHIGFVFCIKTSYGKLNNFLLLFLKQRFFSLVKEKLIFFFVIFFWNTHTHTHTKQTFVSISRFFVRNFCCISNKGKT